MISGSRFEKVLIQTGSVANDNQYSCCNLITSVHRQKPLLKSELISSRKNNSAENKNMEYWSYKTETQVLFCLLDFHSRHLTKKYMLYLRWVIKVYPERLDPEVTEAHQASYGSKGVAVLPPPDPPQDMGLDSPFYTEVHAAWKRGRSTLLLSNNQVARPLTQDLENIGFRPSSARKDLNPCFPG